MSDFLQSFLVVALIWLLVPLFFFAIMIADYYIVPLGVALRCALPAALTGATDPTPAQLIARLSGSVNETWVCPLSFSRVVSS